MNYLFTKKIKESKEDVKAYYTCTCGFGCYGSCHDSCLGGCQGSCKEGCGSSNSSDWYRDGIPITTGP